MWWGSPRGGGSRLGSALSALRRWVGGILARRRTEQLHRGAFAPARTDPDTDDDVEGGGPGSGMEGPGSGLELPSVAPAAAAGAAEGDSGST
jgi:hypothetical protein